MRWFSSLALGLMLPAGGVLPAQVATLSISPLVITEVRAGLERLVDYYAEDTQVAAVLFCVCLQKALFDSKTREPLYEGYDADGGPDQPCLRLLSPHLREIIPGDHARNWVHNLWLLNRGRGIDHFQVWLDRCRHHRIEGRSSHRTLFAH